MRKPVSKMQIIDDLTTKKSLEKISSGENSIKSVSSTSNQEVITSTIIKPQTYCPREEPKKFLTAFIDKF